MQMPRIIVILLFTSLAACSSGPTTDYQTYPELNARQLYDTALASMKSGNYGSAIQRLEALDLRYPFGAYSQQSQLDLIFAYYKRGDDESAISTADRYIRQNPRHPNVDYAYYMKGLVNFNSEIGFFQEVFATKLSERDASSARQAFENFAELMRRYPESIYAPDARQRMIFLRNRLADYEIHVARYYMTRDAFLAAANRAKYVVEHYPKTPAVADALDIMVSAYEILELDTLASDAKKVLQHNYPNFEN
ncbi:MAG: outer membrane protein assembly factor BamD [Gammaproteobacteria bacterium]|nr:MAG: outer membrane protein assembly factor BamD [Gammaproteobacteria bacterium]